LSGNLVASEQRAMAVSESTTSENNCVVQARITLVQQRGVDRLVGIEALTRSEVIRRLIDKGLQRRALPKSEVA
jgi:hypothetical protein